MKKQKLKALVERLTLSNEHLTMRVAELNAQIRKNAAPASFNQITALNEQSARDNARADECWARAVRAEKELEQTKKLLRAALRVKREPKPDGVILSDRQIKPRRTQ